MDSANSTNPPPRRLIVSFLLIVPLLVHSGCKHGDGDSRKRESVVYLDRNGDGKVDLEVHRFHGMADADWDLRDEDHDGRFEKKVVYGVGVFESTVDIAVPTEVKIQSRH